MEATLTLTSTSSAPISGFATSRTSLPGADVGLTTASMVWDMRRIPAQRQQGALPQPPIQLAGERQTHDSSTWRGGPAVAPCTLGFASLAHQRNFYGERPHPVFTLSGLEF